METNEVSRGVSKRNLAVTVVTLLLLSPVIGMVLVFAFLPALPIVLAIGAVLGPMTLLKEIEPRHALQPEEWEARHAMALEAHA